VSDTKNRLTCPICGGAEFQPLFDAVEDTIGRVVYAAAVRCAACDLGVEQTIRIPDDAYSAEYDKHRDQGQGSNRWSRFHHDRAVAEDRLRQLALVIGPPNNRLWTDVGCNNGAFLVAARSAGWDVRGVEADEKVAESLSATLGVRVADAETWATHGNPYGHITNRGGMVVSLFDVLEHVLDPIGALLRVQQLLSAGDFVVIEVPDLDSAVPGESWRHRRISKEFTEHIWHFSAKALRALFAKHLPLFEEVHCATPVPTKLQMVWRKKPAMIGITVEPIPLQMSSLGADARRLISADELNALASKPANETCVAPIVVISEMIHDVEKVASMVQDLPEADRPAVEAAIRQTDSTFAALVQERIDRVKKKAQGD
jgi:hypothetical protein